MSQVCWVLRAEHIGSHGFFGSVVARDLEMLGSNPSQVLVLTDPM